MLKRIDFGSFLGRFGKTEVMSQSVRSIYGGRLSGIRIDPRVNHASVGRDHVWASQAKKNRNLLGILA